MGIPLVRNLATIGGNIGSARPAADLPPALMVYQATLILRSAVEERRLPIGKLFKGPGLTAAGEDESNDTERLRISAMNPIFEDFCIFDGVGQVIPSTRHRRKL